MANIKPELSSVGGTSNGRFIALTDAQVVELGPVNESIHKVNEAVDMDVLDQLTTMYQKVLEKLLM